MITPSIRDFIKKQAVVYQAADELLSSVENGGDELIIAKLQECLDARAQIPLELERFQDLATGARDELERRFRLWQGEAIGRQLERAARCAQQRLQLLGSLRSDEDRLAVMERCQGSEGTLYWFRMFAWGYDPRHPVLKVQPFDPFPYQQQYLRWLDETVFRLGTSGVVEKSRDMGATVATLDWVVKNWLFVPGFSAFFVSANEDLVDSQKDPDTLFEKVRFQLRLTPSWILPQGFNLLRDMTYMNIANPANGAVISGGAPTINVGRQRRATVVFADEFQSWPGGGFAQNTALSQTSHSVLKLGTPFGTINQYYKDTHASGANLFVMDWREHPFKSQAWYDALPFGYGGSPMSPEAIAQEVDRSYEASQPGRVFSEALYRETHIVITISELRAFYSSHDINIPDDGDGRARVPLNWSIGRGNDRGDTPGHRNAWLWCATPHPTHPLSDSVFIFREWLAPIGASFREIADVVHGLERPDKEGSPERMRLSLDSHEAKGERNTYNKEYGLTFTPWCTDYDSGIAEIKDRFTLRDPDQPHPFRPQLAGRPLVYLVVTDGEGELLQKDTGEHYATPARSMAGLANLRRQIKRYHYPPEEEGKPVGQMRPRKIDDDLIDVLRAFATHRWPLPPRMSYEERIEASIPEQYRYENLLKRSPYPNGLTQGLELTYIFNRAQAKKKVRPRIQSFDEDDELIPDEEDDEDFLF